VVAGADGQGIFDRNGFSAEASLPSTLTLALILANSLSPWNLFEPLNSPSSLMLRIVVRRRLLEPPFNTSRLEGARSAALRPVERAPLSSTY